MYGCCYNGYEDSMRIPLIFSGGPLNWSQHVIDKDCYTSSIDIVPTILALCKHNNNTIGDKATRMRVFIILLLLFHIVIIIYRVTYISW